MVVFLEHLRLTNMAIVVLQRTPPDSATVTRMQNGSVPCGRIWNPKEGIDSAHAWSARICECQKTWDCWKAPKNGCDSWYLILP